MKIGLKYEEPPLASALGIRHAQTRFQPYGVRRTFKRYLKSIIGTLPATRYISCWTRTSVLRSQRQHGAHKRCRLHD